MAETGIDPADDLIDHAQGILRPPTIILVVALAASFYAWLNLVTTIPYPGLIGFDYITLGTDWMVFYGAVRSVLDGHAALIFDGDRFTDFLNGTFASWLSHPLAYRPWAYPPSFLLLLLPFAPLGFFGSYLAFQVVTAALLAIALRSCSANLISSRRLVAVALLCPASAINVIDGQAVFLVAALMVGGISLMATRPVLAGLVLGLLTFKPQFCILVPLALIAAGQWRAFFAAGASTLATVAMSSLIFGWDLWLRWFPLIIGNLLNPDEKWISYGRMWGNSVYACAVLLGIPQWLASPVQLLATLGAAASVILAFRSRLSTIEKTAVLLAATVLAAPHSGAYDATLLVIAAAFWLMARGALQPSWHWTLAFMIWLVPIVSPPIFSAAGRFAPLLTVALIALILRSPALRPSQNHAL
jgi:hypothetical protein